MSVALTCTHQDISKDQETLPENRWPFISARKKSDPPPFGHKAKAYIALGTAAAVPDARTTKSHEIRSAYVRRDFQGLYVTICVGKRLSHPEGDG